MNDFEERLFRHAERVRESMRPLDIDPAMGERNDLKMPKKRIGLVIAAVIVAVAGFTAVAATFDWDTKLLEYLNLTPEQAEKLEDSAAYPNVSVTQSDVKVTVRQTLADSRALYIVFDAEAPEGFEFNDKTRFEYSNLDFLDETKESHSNSWDIKLLSYSGNKSTWVLYYYNSEPIESGRIKLTLGSLGYWSDPKPVDNDENGVIKVPYAYNGELEVEKASDENSDVTVHVLNGKVTSGKVRVSKARETDDATTFTYSSEAAEKDGADISKPSDSNKAHDEEGNGGDTDVLYSAMLETVGISEFETVYEGPWELIWNFEYKNSAKVIEPDLLIHDENGTEFTVKRLEISPMSICMDVEQDFDMELKEVPIPSGGTDKDGKVVTIQMAPNPPKPVVNMKDGTQAVLKNSKIGGSFFGFIDGRSGGLSNLVWAFEDGIIDLENVESITYGDQTIIVQ